MELKPGRSIGLSLDWHTVLAWYTCGECNHIHIIYTSRTTYNVRLPFASIVFAYESQHRKVQSLSPDDQHVTGCACNDQVLGKCFDQGFTITIAYSVAWWSDSRNSTIPISLPCLLLCAHRSQKSDQWSRPVGKPTSGPSCIHSIG